MLCICGEFRTRRTPAARRRFPHSARCSRNRPAAGCRARDSGRRSPDRTGRASRTNSSRVGKAISDSSSIGVASCLSGGRRMVKWTRSTDGSAFSSERHTRSPACGSPETSSTRSRSRTPLMATTARLFSSVSSAGPGSAISSTTFSPPWVTGTLIVVLLAHRDELVCRGPCRPRARRPRHVPPASAPKSSTSSSICGVVADNGEARSVGDGELAVALVVLARDQHLQRRLEASACPVPARHALRRR